MFTSSALNFDKDNPQNIELNKEWRHKYSSTIVFSWTALLGNIIEWPEIKVRMQNPLTLN